MPLVILHLARLQITLMWMFDNGETLWTWASDETLPPPDQPFNDRVFEKLADHRRAYLEYEGPVAGNRGYVERIEQGHYQLIVHTDQRLSCNSAATQWRSIASTYT